MCRLPPTPDHAFLSRRFSSIFSASASFRARASARSTSPAGWSPRGLCHRQGASCLRPKTPSANCSTGYPRYLRGDTVRRSSPRPEDLPVRCGSSLPSNADDGSCDGYPRPPSPPMRSTALISISSAFLAVTAMRRKSSLYNQINLSHGRGRRKEKIRK